MTDSALKYTIHCDWLSIKVHTTLWLTQYYDLDKYMLIYLEEGNQNMSDELHVARNWIT